MGLPSPSTGFVGMASCGGGVFIGRRGEREGGATVVAAGELEDEL